MLFKPVCQETFTIMRMTLLPVAGLCNRMRAVDSAIALCAENNSRLKVVWACDNQLACPFHALFKPVACDNVEIVDVESFPAIYKLILERRSKIGWLLRKGMFDKVLFLSDFPELLRKRFTFELLKESGNVLMTTLSRFYDNANMYREFVPVDELQEQIDRRSSLFPPNTVGVHIRRKDHAHAIASSPTNLFVDKMAQEIKEDPDVSFFVASDSVAEKHELKRIFAERVITILKESDRLSVQGVKDGLVELYCLSRTQKILGSSGSSFSQTAAHISGIDYIPVKAAGNALV